VQLICKRKKKRRPVTIGPAALAATALFATAGTAARVVGAAVLVAAAVLVLLATVLVLAAPPLVLE
jgi:hypothetical protein